MWDLPQRDAFYSEIEKAGFKSFKSLNYPERSKILQSGWGVAVDDPIFGGTISDASFLHLKPTFLFRPITIEQLTVIVKLAYQYKMPLTVASGRSGLSGGYANPGIIVDIEVLKSMEHPFIYNFDEEWVRADQSVLVAELIRRTPMMSNNKFIFPVQPSSAFKLPVKVGGLIGSDASGVTSGKLGAIREWILEMEIMTPKGMIVKILPENKRFHDYIGTNARFGIVLNAKIRLFPTPSNFQMAIFYGSDLKGILNGLQTIQDAQIFPLTSEFIMAEGSIGGKFLNYFKEQSVPPTWVVLIKGTQEELTHIEDIFRKHTKFGRTSLNATEFKTLLEERTALALLSIPNPTGETLILFPGFEDVLSPPAQVLSVLSRINDVLTAHYFPSVQIGYGHLNFRKGKGALIHLRYPIPISYYMDRSDQNLSEMSAVISEVSYILKSEFNITPKAEHSVGILYPWYYPAQIEKIKAGIPTGDAFYCPSLLFLERLRILFPNFDALPWQTQLQYAIKILLRNL
jgi:FAD/FMN-containing dehydrogenase